MKVAAIVAEYNPFHNGHQYQIDSARKILGEDTAIIAIMSGNYTQRGELAVTDKLIRAKAAVLCGVDLVLELPHPYSMSSAEFFAGSAVYIADKIGVVDHLVFGVEDCSVQELTEYVEITESEEFSKIFKEISESEEFSDSGYPKICQVAYSKLTGNKNADKFSSPNNILAAEYIRALKRLDSRVTPLPIIRKGAGYNEGFIKGERMQSASAIRALINENEGSALEYIPENARNVFSQAISDGKMPSDEGKLSQALLASLRLNPRGDGVEIHDTCGGLYNRLTKHSFEATDIQSLTTLSETKKYTRARIRRAVWNTFFGVTSSEIRRPPSFTQILGMTGRGRKVLKRIPKMTDFHIFTKPSKLKGLSEEILFSKKRADRADSVYGLALKSPNNGNYYLTLTPFVKEEDNLR